MEFEMVCGTWIKENDEKVLEALRQSDRMLTAEELSEITGVQILKVRRTLNLLKQQMRLAKGRKGLKNYLD